MAIPFSEIRQRLSSALLSDSLDSFGLRDQAMTPGLRPLDEALVLCGRARTGLYLEVHHVEPGENPYALEIRLVDDLNPDEVAVLATNGSRRIGPWGELLSTAAEARGAAGCLTDGLCRDVAAIRRMKFPVFSGGIGPLDSKGRGKIVAIDVPVKVCGVTIAPGDLVFGDVDGVVAIPQAAETEVLAYALSKATAESTTREELRAGESLAVVFARHGIL
jgi:4-hydroxy-4-methyl-2-oxoglutarate aldolase